MSDKHELLILPNNVDSSIVLWETRSSLIARGRRDAASLRARGFTPELLVEVGYGEEPDYIQLEEPNMSAAVPTTAEKV